MLHPASRILVYLLAALAIPALPVYLPVLLLLAALPLLAGRSRRAGMLVWRTRWLLLVMLLGYAYSLPGAPLMDSLGAWSPTHEGVVQGALQVLRLLTLLIWLEILVLRLPPAELLCGLYGLLAPLDRLRLDGSRLAIRLAMTLRAIEHLERRQGGGRGLLEGVDTDELPVTISVPLRPARLIDHLLPLIFLVILGALWLSA